MINRNAMPCNQPFQVSGSPPLSIDTSTLNAANTNATPSNVSSATAKPLIRLRGSSSRTATARRTISSPVIAKVAIWAQPYGPRASELGHGTCSPPTNSHPRSLRYPMLARVFKPTDTKKNGPARSPASAPARRSSLPFTAAPVVLLATSQSYGDGEAGSTTTRRWDFGRCSRPRGSVQHSEFAVVSAVLAAAEVLEPTGWPAPYCLAPL